MRRCYLNRPTRTALVMLCLSLAGCLPDDGLMRMVLSEQRRLDIREPAQILPTAIPPVPPPETVTRPAPDVTPKELSLDEAICIALKNSKVVRVLGGVTAFASGQTIYDPAISNTLIDEQRSVFDPAVSVQNNFNHLEGPQAIFDLTYPAGVSILGPRSDSYTLNAGVSKKDVLGGILSFNVAEATTRFPAGLSALNPLDTSSMTLSYTQPLLQGAGIRANVAPIVIARLNTERSYFQFKDSVQELVRGVIEAYWGVVFSRTDVWTRRQQVEQGEFNSRLTEARFRAGLANEAVFAQTRVALANFRANLIAAESTLLQREALLRSILGLPPSEPERLVLTSLPSTTQYEPQWEELLRLASENRPDLIELKLIIEADQQNITIAENQVLPRVDATMLYRWNGLEGQTPGGFRVSSDPGQFTDWTLGVNFAVPLGLRQSRAGLRRAELLLARDRVNLDQGLLTATHVLAINVRNLAQFYAQYRAFQEARAAARLNLEQQLAEYRVNRTIFLNVLQAITDWGNAVSAEAQALSQYNTELANLERQTGTILETHGVRFVEERFRSVGPLGRLAQPVCYPFAVAPGPNGSRYPTSPDPIESILDREKPRAPGGPAIPEEIR